jgi:hypothetical protein
MASASDRRLGFPLTRLRELEREVIAALNTVAEEASYAASEPTSEANVRRSWTLLHATLGAEAAESARLLADNEHLRMVIVLVRSLYEYSNKISYYANHLPEALSDAKDGWKFRERMMEVALSDFVPTIEPLSKETKIKHANIAQIVDSITSRANSVDDSGQRFKRHYHEGFYAYASAIAHGSSGAINEIVRFEPPDAEVRHQIWQRRRREELKVIAHAQITFQAWLLLFTLTKFSPTRHSIDVDRLLDRWKTFDQPLLDFKNANMREVGPEQAFLDALGT